VWEKIEHDLQNINIKSKLILFADDTSIIVTNPNAIDFKNDVSTVFEHKRIWFKLNLLSLNFDKTPYIQFITKNNSFVDMNLDYNQTNFSCTSYKISCNG
jgi:uncharacterized protein YdaL